MNRYKKANEGIHAPEEVKEKAVRPAGRPVRARWVGAVAAVLAVAILGGVALWPRQSNPIDPMSLDGPRGVGPNHILNPTPSIYAQATALAAVVYPETVPYPKEEDYTFPTGELDWNRYDAAHRAWRESRDSLRSGTDYAGLLDEILSASTAQILTDAGAENRVYSPLNVWLALSMLAETAGGNSREQLLDLLGADSTEDLRTLANALWRDSYRDDGTAASILANSLWLRDGMTYSQEVLDTLAADYYASSFSGEMGSEGYNQALRDWMNEQTHGLLKAAADGLETYPDTVLALASTVYFKAGWANKFREENTREDIFHAPGHDLTVDFMHASCSQTYYWGDRFSAVSLDCEDQEHKMWLILPDEGYDPDGLLDSGEAMDFLLANKSRYDSSKYLIVNLSMPKFDVSSNLDLIGGLKALGVTDIFNDAVSNFDPLGASTDDPLVVSKAQHAARVKVDEEGCEAAAYTVIMVEPTSAPPPPTRWTSFWTGPLSSPSPATAACLCSPGWSTSPTGSFCSFFLKENGPDRWNRKRA